MSKRPLMGAAPFAHLFGGGVRAAKAEDDKPEDKKKDDAKKAKGAAAEDADDLDETDKVDGDTDEGVDGDDKPDLGDVEDPDDSVDEDAAPEEDDVDPKVKKAAKSGRKAERSRWSKVMGHSSAAGRVPAACQLLSTTTMSARAIVGTLKTLPAEAAESPQASRGSLYQRQAERPQQKVGADRVAAPAGDFGSEVKAALNKVRPA